MKKTAVSAILCMVWICAAASAAAETRYVSDLNEITLRRGPGLEYRIERMLVTGQELEVLEEEDRWTRVRLTGDDESTGWVFSKFLSEKKPASLMVSEMRQQVEPLRQKAESLEDENQRLIERNQELADSLEETTEQLENTKDEYEDLKEQSGEFLELQEKYDALQENAEEKDQRIETLEKRISDAFLSSALKWFLAGAGVLVLGIIFGRGSARKKKSSLL